MRSDSFAAILAGALLWAGPASVNAQQPPSAPPSATAPEGEEAPETSPQQRVPQRFDPEAPVVRPRPPGPNDNTFPRQGDRRQRGVDPPPPPQYMDTAARPQPPALRSASPDSATAAMQRMQPGTTNNATEELIRQARTDVDFFELVDEMLDEVAYQLGKQDPAVLSPLAIRLVRLSPNLRPEFAATLQARLLARVAQSTAIRTAVCVECTSMKSRVEDGQWLVSVGAVRQEDLRRIGQAQGIKTFVDLGFMFNARSNTLWMEAVAFRASDGAVMWTDAYRSDMTTAMLLRTGRRIPSREERLLELERKIAARPYYGYMVGLGLLRFNYDGPTGDIMGPQVTIRIHERFGEDQRQLFGLSGGFFTTGAPATGKTTINTIMGGAYYSWDLSPPSLNVPELWLYGELGGMFSGNQGNTAYGEVGLDYHMKWRLSMVGGVQYVLPTKFADYDLGGIGYRLRLAFNW